MISLGNLLVYGGIATGLWIVVASFILFDGRDDINQAEAGGARKMRRGARLLLATPIFPAILVAVIGIALVKGIRALIALAEPRAFFDPEEKP